MTTYITMHKSPFYLALLILPNSQKSPKAMQAPKGYLHESWGGLVPTALPNWYGEVDWTARYMLHVPDVAPVLVHMHLNNKEQVKGAVAREFRSKFSLFNHTSPGKISGTLKQWRFFRRDFQILKFKKFTPGFEEHIFGFGFFGCGFLEIKFTQ